MTVKDAVAKRFRQICKERSIKPNELANRAGITPSSVYSMLDPKRREVSVNLVKKLCDGVVSLDMAARGTGVDSFNVSVAAGIILYEIQSQRAAQG